MEVEGPANSVESVTPAFYDSRSIEEKPGDPSPTSTILDSLSGDWDLNRRWVLLHLIEEDRAPTQVHADRDPAKSIDGKQRGPP